MPKRRSLNQADIQKMEELLAQDKRSEMYKFYYELTDSKVAKEMSEISSLKGRLGRVAVEANAIAEMLSSNYPKNGLPAFSREIARDFLDNIKRNLRQGKNGRLADLEILRNAHNVWKNKGIGKLFPGRAVMFREEFEALFFEIKINSAVGIKMLEELGFAGTFVDLALLNYIIGNRISNVYGNVFSGGFFVGVGGLISDTAKSAYRNLRNLFGLNKSPKPGQKQSEAELLKELNKSPNTSVFDLLNTSSASAKSKQAFMKVQLQNMLRQEVKNRVQHESAILKQEIQQLVDQRVQNGLANFSPFGTGPITNKSRGQIGKEMWQMLAKGLRNM